MTLLSSGHDIIEENERKIFENCGIHASAWTKFWPPRSWSNYFCSEWADNYEGLTEQRFNVPMLWESRELPTRCLISIWILMNMNRDWLFFFVIKFQSFHAWYEIDVFWLWVLNQCHTVVPSLYPTFLSVSDQKLLHALN